MSTSVRPQRGMTLVETMVVLAIVSAAMGGAVLSYRSLSRAQLRTNAQKMASALRYLYDRSIGTGQYYRLSIDLTENTYEAQKSDSRFYLSREKEKTQGDDDAQRKIAEDEDQRKEAEERSNAGQMGRFLQSAPRAKRARFESFSDAMLPKVTLKGTKIRDVYTPHQEEPYRDGKAYIYFFPDGHAERAIIHISDGDEDDEQVYTLILHPLNGRVEIQKGDIDVPTNFDDTDDEGNREGGR